MHELQKIIFQIIIYGSGNDGSMSSLIDCIHSQFIPNKILIRINPDRSSSFVAKKLPILQDLHEVEGKATVYVCENYSCQLPVTSCDELKTLLQ